MQIAWRNMAQLLGEIKPFFRPSSLWSRGFLHCRGCLRCVWYHDRRRCWSNIRHFRDRSRRRDGISLDDFWHYSRRRSRGLLGIEPTLRKSRIVRRRQLSSLCHGLGDGKDCRNIDGIEANRFNPTQAASLRTYLRKRQAPAYDLDNITFVGVKHRLFKHSAGLAGIGRSIRAKSRKNCCTRHPSKGERENGRRL